MEIKNIFTNAVTCTAITFLVTGIVIVIPLACFLVIWGVLGIFTLFFSTIGWLTAITGYIALILFCLPFVLALIAGILGFIWKLFHES